MIKVTVSTSLKGELVLSAIRAKLRPGATVEITEEAAKDADVLWARKKGYISFDSADDILKSAPAVSDDEIEFVNAMKGGVTIPFLGRTLSAQQRFILKKDDKNIDKAMKMVNAGYLTCTDVAAASPSIPQESQVKEKKPTKKGSRQSFRRKKSGGEAQQSAEIFGLMNTEVT